jgi:hypothetical protein
MTIRPVRADFLYTDRRTDTTKLIVALRNPSKAPKESKKNWLFRPEYVYFNLFLQNEILIYT